MLSSYFNRVLRTTTSCKVLGDNSLDRLSTDMAEVLLANTATYVVVVVALQVGTAAARADVAMQLGVRVLLHGGLKILQTLGTRQAAQTRM